MNIYRISQNDNQDYDTYDSAIVAAESMQQAALIHPSGKEWDGKTSNYDSWTSWDNVEVEFIGNTPRDIKGVILASFNAG